jgi:hypothetical protein
MRLTSLTILATLALAACATPDFQTTSGADYLAARPAPSDPQVARAAAVEGDLRFPARIGLVRLVNGKMEPLPPAEAEEIGRMAKGLYGFGEFAPLSQTIAALIPDAPRDGVALARVTAARQHMDYLVVLAHDLSTATVEALFVDVRTGYVYANAQAGDGGQTMRSSGDVDRVNRRTLALTREITPQLAEMFAGLGARQGEI